jgi:hypothetical protein
VSVEGLEWLAGFGVWVASDVVAIRELTIPAAPAKAPFTNDLRDKCTTLMRVSLGETRTS